MRVELLRDAERERGWWLMVGASEQSFVDIDDPAHLEFEYVQLMSYVIETAYPEDLPLAALHLGGGLCTVPRWLADRYPGSTQRVAEASDEIAGLARSLDPNPPFVLDVIDAADALAGTAPASMDLLVSDVYTGPDTVLSVYPQPALAIARAALRDDGLYVCNISDAKRSLCRRPSSRRCDRSSRTSSCSSSRRSCAVGGRATSSSARAGVRWIAPSLPGVLLADSCARE
jgi:hypothetical protein